MQNEKPRDKNTPSLKASDKKLQEAIQGRKCSREHNKHKEASITAKEVQKLAKKFSRDQIKIKKITILYTIKKP